MIRLGFYQCLWTGCPFQCDDGEDMIKHVAEEHTRNIHNVH